MFNGRTTEERVDYYMTLPADSLAGRHAARLPTALREPLFLQDELERERQVVIGEYDRNESNPFFQLQTEMEQAALPRAVEPQERHRRSRRDLHGDAGQDARDPAQATTCLTTRR